MSFANQDDAARAMVEAARAFYGFGWLMGTSGNLSVRLSADTFLITASGKDKGALTVDDFLVCDLSGNPTHDTPHKPSAETLVHTEIYKSLSDVGAVFHVHDPYAALCSARDGSAGHTRFKGLEMIKGLGFWEPEAVVAVPIVPNHSEIPELAAAVARNLTDVPAVMVHNHGFYAWGKSAFDAKRHTEALAYLYKHAWASRD